MNPPPRLPPIGAVELRALKAAGAEAIFATVDESRAHLRVWLPWVDSSQDPSATRAFLEQHERSAAEGGTAGYALWENGRVIGIAGLHDIDASNRAAAIGYWLAAAAQGRGLITETVRRLLDLGFGGLELERIEIRCATGNTRSWAVPERLGFAFEGVLRHRQWLNGRPVDLRLYSLLAGEWAARRL
jgi:ribosomal-protein-serine acetyltransferase